MQNLRKRLSIKKITLISILVAFSVILSVFDKYISIMAFPFLPTAKIGLANIVIVLAVYRFDFEETFVMVILKSFLAGLIVGGVVSFLISFFASALSFLGMEVSRRILKNTVSPISISVIGGFLHIAGQLFIVSMIIGNTSAVLYYGAILILISLATSIIIGFLAIRLLGFIDKLEYENS